jgi:hypothetical protein
MICEVDHAATGAVEEVLVCTNVPSSGGKTVLKVFNINMKADVVVPLLDLSQQSMEFTYFHQQGTPPAVIVQQLHMRYSWIYLLSWQLSCNDYIL